MSIAHQQPGDKPGRGASGPRIASHTTPATPVVHEYRDAGGKTLYRRVVEGNSRQYEKPPKAKGGDWSKGLPAELVPYTLDSLTRTPDPAEVVYVATGDDAEEMVDALIGIDVLATCAVADGVWSNGDWEPFLSGRRVAVLSRPDQIGLDQAASLAGAVCRYASEVKVIVAQGLQPHMGVAEWFGRWDDLRGDPRLDGYTSPEVHPLAEMLRRDYDQAKPIALEPEAGPDKPAEARSEFDDLDDADMGIECAAGVKLRPVDWLWPGRIALGKMNLLAGEGGDGKSQLSTAFSASVTTGNPLPDGTRPLRTGTCLIVAAEDSPADTIVPRLTAAGADLDRVRFVSGRPLMRGKDGKRFVCPMGMGDLGYWREIFRRHPDACLLIVDPLPAYLGRGVNDHRNNDVRDVLEPFVGLLDECGVGMLAITHMNKSVDTKTPTHRILGSVAYANLSRTVHVTCRDPENKERRMFCWVKGNLTEPQPTLAFKIERHTLDADGQEIVTSRLAFEDKPVDADAAEIMSGKPSKRGPDPKKTTEVAEWLFDFLHDQKKPVCLAAIFDAAGGAGLIGERNAKGKWSGIGTLYDAVKRAPLLLEPRNGYRIETLEIKLAPGGRDIKHWYLCSAGASF